MYLLRVIGDLQMTVNFAQFAVIRNETTLKSISLK